MHECTPHSYERCGLPTRRWAHTLRMCWQISAFVRAACWRVGEVSVAVGAGITDVEGGICDKARCCRAYCSSAGRSVEPGLDGLGGVGIGEAEGQCCWVDQAGCASEGAGDRGQGLPRGQGPGEGRCWDEQAGRGEGGQERSGEAGGSTKAGGWE